VKTLAELPSGAVVGTASLRRQAQVLRQRPDLRVVPFRGNVETRLRKLDAGEVDATLLALAGLNRLGYANVAASLLGETEFLPAVGQGAITIEARAADARVITLIAAIDDAATAVAVKTERAFLTVLDGSCRTPIGALARLSGTQVHFRGEVIRPDGSETHTSEISGTAADAETIGRDAGADLKRRMPADFFNA
jgi:hydroxymethylbilane synthase